MKYKIEIKEEAEREIIQAYTYYESEVPGLGDRFLKQVELYLNRIKKNPQIFESKHPLYRDAFIKKFPYLIIYEIIDQSVVVYSVFNTYQNPKTKYK